MTFWIFLALLALVAGMASRRRRFAAAAEQDEPWRRSLQSEDDEGLDLDEIRRAEAEWENTEEWDSQGDDEVDWR